MPKLELSEPQDIFTDAATTLYAYCDQLENTRTEAEITKARRALTTCIENLRLAFIKVR